MLTIPLIPSANPTPDFHHQQRRIHREKTALAIQRQNKTASIMLAVGRKNNAF
uniref:Uncharacterized protein n=1 Tax=Rheinheimera sp. BAL341 TaxID=1708203 RepID=A0A486XSB2_9GAMM